MTVVPNGEDVLVASGSPYSICALTIPDFIQDGTYPTGDGPNAVTVTHDSQWIAAGIRGGYESDEVFLFEAGNTDHTEVDE